MKKKILCLTLCLALAVSTAGCTTESGQTSAATSQETSAFASGSGTESGQIDVETSRESSEAASGSTYTPGTYTGIAKGFGGDVTVIIEVDGEKIIAVQAEGPNETDGVGSRAIDQLPEAMEVANSAQVEAVSGASITSEAVMTAAAQALAEASGQEAAATSLAMNPGTYTGQATGYAGTIVVEVTVTEDAISSIKYVDSVGKSNELIPSIEEFYYAHYAWAVQNDSPQIIETVTNVLPDRIVNAQSLSVDAVTGATATSNGFIGAVKDAVIQAGGDPAAINRPIEKSTATETYDGYDVIVVGGGTSGATAAARATSLGAKVLIIEKSGRIGGTGALSSEPTTLGADIQLETGKDYDVIDEYYESLMSQNHWYPKGILVRKFLENSADTVNWMMEEADFNWIPEDLTNPDSPHESDRLFGHCLVGYDSDSISTMDAAESWKRLVSDVDTILFETTAQELIQDADGSVTGVVAKRYDGTKIIASGKTVIIATGGFAGSAELMEQYNRDSYKVFGLTQNVGEGLLMMLEAGAVKYNIGGMCAHVTDVAGDVTGFDDFDSAIPYTLHATPSILRVNSRGERFASENEKAISMLSSSMYTAAQGSEFYTIVSQQQMDVLAEDGIRGTGMESEIVAVNFHHYTLPIDYKMENINEVMEAGVEAGFIYKADTLEDLAQLTGMDPQTLMNHVQRYNTACANGDDDLFNKDASLLFPLGDDGPYYAIKCNVLVYSSLGGVEVDENMQVLDSDGKAIPGLYAAGVDTIGNILDGTAYPDHLGIAFGWGINSGKLAGEAAATAVKSD